MSRKIKVPEEMLEAAANAMRAPSGPRFRSTEEWATTGLEAALGWLDAKLEEMDKDEPFDRDLQIRRVRDLWTAQ